MIDAHIHLDDNRFDGQRKELLADARKAGVSQFIVPAVAVSGFEKLNKLTHEYKGVFAAYGLHPYYIERHQVSDINYLDQYLTNNNSCAVGECGLDFFLKNLDRKKQTDYLQAQIELAIKHQLPLVLHARGAVDAVYNLLKENNYFNAMIHSYNGSIEQSRRLLDYDIKFSFGGAICHPQAHKIHKLVRFCPLDNIMFETDAPDQNLYPNQKKSNKPSNLKTIVECYADLKHYDCEQVKFRSILTTRSFFNIPY